MFEFKKIQDEENHSYHSNYPKLYPRNIVRRLTNFLKWKNYPVRSREKKRERVETKINHPHSNFTIELQLLFHRVIIHLIKIRNVLTINYFFIFVGEYISIHCLNSRKFKIKRITYHPKLYPKNIVRRLTNFLKWKNYGSQPGPVQWREKEKRGKGLKRRNVLIFEHWYYPSPPFVSLRFSLMHRDY